MLWNILSSAKANVSISCHAISSIKYHKSKSTHIYSWSCHKSEIRSHSQQITYNQLSSETRSHHHCLTWEKRIIVTMSNTTLWVQTTQWLRVTQSRIHISVWLQREYEAWYKKQNTRSKIHFIWARSEQDLSKI